MLMAIGGALPGYADVESAAIQLAGVVSVTPVMTSEHADAATGARLFFKMENLQRGGAFKFRGAYNALSRLPLEAKRLGVVAFSSGNHAQATALAAKLLGIPATIIMPEDAPVTKLAATRGHGAEVILYDRHHGNREAVAADLVARHGLTLIPPFDHPHIIAGQGTAARELFQEIGALDMIFAPVGGGGLAAGTALAAAELSPGCRVIGVEPEAGDDARRSLEAGAIMEIPTPRTIADGAQTRRIGDQTFPILQRRLDRIVTVPDTDLQRMMRFFAERMKQVVEPTGCLGAAGAFALAEPGARIGVIVSGGNVDLSAYAHHLTAPGAVA